ncbi:DUF4124 domain-containing protein [Marinobacter koreensis]|uniref:DUF4124 domain-containing protein n=1 Tax=Marinobacter koreensis TaxID=335974 RepID=UPI00362298ED
MLKRTVLSIAIIIPTIAQAAVYQCKVNGQTVFSDHPCGSDAKEIEVNAPPINGGTSMQTEAGDKFVKSRELDREIKRLERKRKSSETPWTKR